VTEYFWKFDYSYELCAFRGVGEKPTDVLHITGRAGGCEIKTSTYCIRARVCVWVVSGRRGD
jgi:hypothetical protein